jgi:hypothetical protein
MAFATMITPLMKSDRARLLWMTILPVMVAGYYVIMPSGVPLLTPDSISYIDFYPDRPIGYPAALAVTKYLTGDYSNIRYVQILMYCFATGLLGIAVWRFSRSLFMALIVQLGILGHPGPINLAQSVMSDSLSASVILLFVCALFYFFENPSLKRYALICGVAAVSITLRPVNIALIAVPMVLAISCQKQIREQIWTIGLVCVAIISVGIAITPIASRLIHGNFETSTPLARGLFQKAIFTDRRPGDLLHEECDASYIESITGPINAYLQTVPAEMQQLMRFQYSQIIRFSSILPGLEQRHSNSSSNDRDKILMCYTLERFREDPMAVVRQSVDEYWNLISNYTFITQQQRNRYLAFLSVHAPVLPPMNESPVATFDPPAGRPLFLIMALKVVQLLAAIVTAVLAVLTLIRTPRFALPNNWLIVGLIALAAQSLLAATAVIEMAQPRYFFPVWPLFWTVLVLAAFGAVSSARAGRRPLKTEGVGF